MTIEDRLPPDRYLRDAGVSPLTSARRIDFYDDPDAPRASSLVPSVNVVVVDGAGDILLIRRTDNSNWALPGGAIELGESVAQAAVRETLRKPGSSARSLASSGIYSDPKHVILYTSNGEARQEFSIVLTARPLSGQPTPSSESCEVRWVSPSDLLSYSMDRSMRIRINDFLAQNESPVIPPGHVVDGGGRVSEAERYDHTPRDRDEDGRGRAGLARAARR